MGKVSTRRLQEILQRLSRMGAVDYARDYVYSAGLNIVDRPSVATFIPELAEPLYQQLAESGIEYDAITSCPRGGNAWAEALVAKANAADGRDVPFYRLNKVSTGRFSIMDGQPIKTGSRLVLADDTLFRGTTSSAAVEVLEEAGFKVVGLVFPVEIGDSGRERWDEKGYPVFSIYNNKSLSAGLGRR